MREDNFVKNLVIYLLIFGIVDLAKCLPSIINTDALIFHVSIMFVDIHQNSFLSVITSLIFIGRSFFPIQTGEMPQMQSDHCNMLVSRPSIFDRTRVFALQRREAML